MNLENLKVLLEIGEERPSLDYKQSVEWSKNIFTKDILAMSNIRPDRVILLFTTVNASLQTLTLNIKPNERMF